MSQAEETETDWSKYDRVIIEYCCYPDSLMGKRTPDSKGCKVIRVTTSHDQTTEEGYWWLLNQIRKIPVHIPILLWGSIPCTGGTPWARYNLRRYPDTFPKRLRRLRVEWRELTYNFFRVSEIIRRRNGYWALEWPSKCSIGKVLKSRSFSKPKRYQYSKRRRRVVLLVCERFRVLYVTILCRKHGM